MLEKEMRTKFDITKLKPLHNNPRSISKENFERLKRDILDDPEFLEKRPLLVNKVGDEYIVYAGNMRLKACIDLGWKEVPVDIDEDLDLNIMRKRALRDNVEYGETDYDILANEWADLVEQLDLPELELPSIEDFSDKNYEVNNNDLGDESVISFRFKHQEYLNLLAQLQNAQERLGLDTNEQVLKHLLQEYV